MEVKCDDKSSDNDIGIVVPRDSLSTPTTMEVLAIIHNIIYTYYVCRVYAQLLTAGRPYKMSLQKTTLFTNDSRFRV
jgi:hypothetical protein